MKITIVQGPFLPIPPVAGGAVEKLWYDLAREFARRGLGVTHISRRWPGLPSNDQQDGVSHRRVAGFDQPRSRLLSKVMDFVYSLRCFVAVRRSDIIVTNTFFLPMMLSLFRRGAVYVSVHRYPQGQMGFYRRVDRLQCVSTAIADAVRDQAPAVGRLVKVVPNYISSRMTETEVTAEWAGRRKEVLFVGRIHPDKGVDLLIEGFAGLATDLRADWTLRVVGPHDAPAGGGGTAFFESLKKLAAERNVPVEWTGPIYDADALNAAYRRAAIFVYPSVAGKREAFPLAPLEAMAQGCPVVTSDLRCFSDFIRAGANASMFPLTGPDVAAQLGGSIAALMQDEPLRKRYSRAGLATVAKFTLGGVADVFVDDFEALSRA